MMGLWKCRDCGALTVFTTQHHAQTVDGDESGHCGFDRVDDPSVVLKWCWDTVKRGPADSLEPAIKLLEWASRRMR